MHTHDLQNIAAVSIWQGRELLGHQVECVPSTLCLDIKLGVCLAHSVII